MFGWLGKNKTNTEKNSNELKKYLCIYQIGSEIGIKGYLSNEYYKVSGLLFISRLTNEKYTIDINKSVTNEFSIMVNLLNHDYLYSSEAQIFDIYLVVIAPQKHLSNNQLKNKLEVVRGNSAEIEVKFQLRLGKFQE